MPITFEVDPTKKPENPQLKPSTIEDYLQLDTGKEKGKLITATNSSTKYVTTRFNNGFVGACLTAYNLHLDLALGPDDVWVTLMTSLSRYINANAEKLRHLFVSHEGKLDLVATSGGNIYSANYSNLISQISDQIDQNTKNDLRNWVECDFSTTTPLQKVVSKVALMGAMQQYFSYKFEFCCGLPKVTLLGTVEDWANILARINKMGSFEDQTLQDWSKVLGFVFQNFVDAFNGKIDRDFWNRIAHITGGGSGPRYLEGWVLAIIGFDDAGKYILNPLKNIQSSNRFGRLNTNDVPTSVVEVPVKIDDNGKEHNTKLYAGSMLPAFDGKTIFPTLDWALVDILP